MTLNVPVCSFYLLQKEPQKKKIKKFCFHCFTKWKTYLTCIFPSSIASPTQYFSAASRFLRPVLKSSIVTRRKNEKTLNWLIGSNLICILFFLSFTHTHIYMQSTDAYEELHVNIIHVCCSTVLGIFSGRAIKQVQVESKSSRSFCSIM